MRQLRWIALLVALVVAGCSSGTADVVAPRKVVATTTSLPAASETEPTTQEAPTADAASTEVVPEDPSRPEDPILAGAARPAPPVRRAAGKREPTGRIEIPAIGLSHPTYEGIDLPTINHGPSHWPGTPKPGEAGNTVFPGHRTTYSRPFWDIDKLVPGNEVIFTTPAGRFTYQVTETFVVGAKETWIVGPTEGATFTIFACHPKGSARQRYVAKGRLVSAPAPSAAPPETTSTTAAAPPPSQPPPEEERPPGLVPGLP